ncbi:transposase [Streptomyces sp. AD55]|uniref:transposase n=1 Tax=Streptomyces sp. AD55 TaxID=3242895 RepID=UPI003526CADE
MATPAAPSTDTPARNHVGHDPHDAAGRNSGGSRNGARGKTSPTDVGPVEVKVPRDTACAFEPQFVSSRSS